MKKERRGRKKEEPIQALKHILIVFDKHSHLYARMFKGTVKFFLRRISNLGHDLRLNMF